MKKSKKQKDARNTTKYDAPPRREKQRATRSTALFDDQAEQVIVPFDENLLERGRTQWQFGDWEALTRMNREQLQNHPDRAKLALLAAAGWLQSGRDPEARQFIRLALDWGVSRKLLTRIIAAGVHNSLGRVAAIAGDHAHAQEHFNRAIATGSPGSEARLLGQARINYQYNQLGLPPPTLVDALSAVAPTATSLLASESR